MNYPFNQTSSLKIRRVLSLALVAAMTSAALTGCFSSTKGTEPIEDTSSNIPNLLESTEPEEQETEPTVEETTEPEPENVAVVKEQLSVRSSPSTGSNVTSTLDAAEKVEVLRVEPVNGTQWAYIYSAATGIKGWVTTESLDMSNVQAAIDNTTTPGNIENPNGAEVGTEVPGDTAPSTNGSTNGVVTATQLNIRSQADASSDRVGSLSYGDRINIQETKGSWGRIKQGWVSLDYVYIDGRPGKNNATGTISATELMVRSGPGTGYDKVSSLKQGATVEVLEQIRVGNTVWGCIKGGWISMDYVSVNGSTGGTIGNTGTNTNTNGTNNNNGTGIGTATVTGNGLNIRSGAGTNYGVVGALNKGQTVTVYERADADGHTWGRIDQGWICLDYTTLR